MCSRMVGKRRVRSGLCQVVGLLLCFLNLSTQSTGLKQNGDVRKDADALGFSRGTILFGTERVAGFKSNVTDGATKPLNTSAGEGVGYQADNAGWSRDYDDDADSSKVEWRHMDTSLQCGGDRMKFRAMGPRASQFQVVQGPADPLPLSQVPQTCGYSMQTNPLGFVMVVPYDGCNVMQQNQVYVLPLLWQGTPVSLLCPQPSPSPLPAEPAKPPSYLKLPQVEPQSQNQAAGWGDVPHFLYPEPTTTPTTTQKPAAPKVPQYPFYYPPFMHYPFYPATTKAPTTTKPPATAAKKQPSFYPYAFFPPYFFPQPSVMTTTAKPTTTIGAAKPQLPAYPPYLPVYPPYFPYPVAPTTTTTTKPPTTKAQPAVPPHFHPHVHLPYPPFFPYPVAPPTTTTTTTKPPTTKAEPAVPQHFHPHVHLPYPPFFPYPAAPPTTTTTTKPPTTKAQPAVPPHFHPHVRLPYPPYFPYPVASPTTTTTTTAKPSTTTKAQPVVPPHFHPHVHLPYPPFFPYPAAPTTTTTTWEPTTKAPVKPQHWMPLHYHPHVHTNVNRPVLHFLHPHVPQPLFRYPNFGV